MCKNDQVLTLAIFLSWKMLHQVLNDAQKQNKSNINFWYVEILSSFLWATLHWSREGTTIITASWYSLLLRRKVGTVLQPFLHSFCNYTQFVWLLRFYFESVDYFTVVEHLFNLLWFFWFIASWGWDAPTPPSLVCFAPLVIFLIYSKAAGTRTRRIITSAYIMN